MSSEPSPCHPDACPAAVERGSVRRPTPPCSRSCSSPTEERLPAASAPWPGGWGSHRRRLLGRGRGAALRARRRTRRCASGPLRRRTATSTSRPCSRRAKKTGAEAVHPGYGFVSENAEFARACTDAGITFVGPPPEAMARMKDKSQARKLVAAGRACPWCPAARRGAGRRRARCAAAERIGYPVLCKAAGGGGGIGMAAAKDPAELEKVFRQCTDRAKAAFGREGVYLERYFPAPAPHRGADPRGPPRPPASTCLERECSIQRRHQKVVEEAPSPAVRWTARNAALSAAAVRRRRSPRRKAFGYANAGTVEFLVLGRRSSTSSR